MVILWSSYGDPMVRVLFESDFGVVPGLFRIYRRYTKRCFVSKKSTKSCIYAIFFVSLHQILNL